MGETISSLDQASSSLVTQLFSLQNNNNGFDGKDMDNKEMCGLYQ